MNVVPNVEADDEGVHGKASAAKNIGGRKRDTQ